MKCGDCTQTTREGTQACRLAQVIIDSSMEFNNPPCKYFTPKSEDEIAAMNAKEVARRSILTPAEQRVIEAIRAIRYGSVTVEVANGVLTLLRKGETEKL
jgi:hypothetical protein